MVVAPFFIVINAGVRSVTPAANVTMYSDLALDWCVSLSHLRIMLDFPSPGWDLDPNSYVGKLFAGFFTVGHIF